MNAAAARFEVLPGGRAERPAEGDTSWLDAEPTETDNSPTSPWNPEHQLVGSLMWLPSDTVRRIAAVVEPLSVPLSLPLRALRGPMSSSVALSLPVDRPVQKPSISAIRPRAARGASIVMPSTSAARAKPSSKMLR